MSDFYCIRNRTFTIITFFLLYKNTFLLKIVHHFKKRKKNYTIHLLNYLLTSFQYICFLLPTFQIPFFVMFLIFKSTMFLNQTPLLVWFTQRLRVTDFKVWKKERKRSKIHLQHCVYNTRNMQPVNTNMCYHEKYMPCWVALSHFTAVKPDLRATTWLTSGIWGFKTCSF